MKNFVLNFTSVLSLRIILGFFIILVSSFTCAQNDTKSTIHENVPVENGEPLPEVTITIDKLNNLTLPIVHSYSAKVEAQDQAKISPEASGIVNNIKVEVGSRVKKGDILLSIDCESLNYDKAINLAQKKAQLASVKLAKKQVSRYTTLKSKGAATQMQIDEFSSSADTGTAQLGVFDANIRKIEFLLKKCKILAPFNGIITQKFVSVGEFVSPGVTLFTLMNIDTNEVVVNLRPELIKQLQNNISNAKFTFNGKSNELNIKTIIPAINSLANTQEVRLSAMNPNLLLNNANGELIWSAGLALPSRYITQREHQFGIYLHDPKSNKFPFAFFPLPDANEGSSIRIDHLLKGDVEVVTSGLGKIGDDSAQSFKIVYAN